MSAPRKPASEEVERRAPKRGEKGGRARVVSVRVLAQELDSLQERSQAAGLSLGAYLRSCALGDAGPRAKRAPSVNAVLLAQAMARLNKVGSNLNQIAHAMNIDRLAGRSVSATITLQTLSDVRQAVAEIRAAVGRRDAADAVASPEAQGQEEQQRAAS